MKPEITKRILEEPDYINSKRYKNSLTLFMKANARGVTTDSVIAHLLCMDVEDVEDIYNTAIASLRDAMGVDLD